MKPYIRCSFSTTALIAPSSPDHIYFPVRYQRAVDNLRRFTPNVIESLICEAPAYLPGKLEDRVKELYAQLENPYTDLLMTISGGYNSGDIIDYLDYDRLAEKWKPLVGFSDTTALQIALYTKKKLVSFYGPSLIPSFGEYPDINGYTVDSLNTILTSKTSINLLQACSVSESNYYWDIEDKKANEYVKREPWKFISSKSNYYTEGILIGGNLDTLLSLIGSEYWIHGEDKILFFEEAFTCPKKLSRSLKTLQRTGIMNNVRGVLIGRSFCPGKNSVEKELINNLMQNFARNAGVPVVLDMDFGHGTPMLTLPIGTLASIDCKNGEVTLLEPSVVVGDSPRGRNLC